MILHNIRFVFKSVLIQIATAAEIIGLIHTDVDNISGKSLAQRCNHPCQQGLDFGITDIKNVVNILVFVFNRFPHKILINMCKRLNTRYKLYTKELCIAVDFL